MIIRKFGRINEKKPLESGSDAWRGTFSGMIRKSGWDQNPTIDHKQQYNNHALKRKERSEKEIVSGRENQQNESVRQVIFDVYTDQDLVIYQKLLEQER